MSYSLLAHLYPRIKGSQEDVATFSLTYILEQSPLLNESFTKLICRKMGLDVSGSITYHCQDSDKAFGRPDIAGYCKGKLKLLCEAKFYAGLTDNQPVSYIKRLQDSNETGLMFICPKSRIVSLWDKLKKEAANAGFSETPISEYSVSYGNTRLSIISWGEILSELIYVATERVPEYLDDLRQLEGFCEKVESESFIPFRPEEFGAQTARDIDRYYQVVDETHKLLQTHKEWQPQTTGLRGAPRWQGYSQYIRMNQYGVSISFIRALWKRPTSVETPFWCGLQEILNDKWTVTDKITGFMSSVAPTMHEEFHGVPYIALIPKPYVTIDELAEDLTDQVLGILRKINSSNL